MAISSMIIQTSPNAVQRVTEELAGICGVSVHGVSPKQEIIIVVESVSLSAAVDTARKIEAITGVLGVFPAYVTMADEDVTGS